MLTCHKIQFDIQRTRMVILETALRHGEMVFKHSDQTQTQEAETAATGWKTVSRKKTQHLPQPQKQQNSEQPGTGQTP